MMVTIALFVVALQMNYFLFRWLARNRFKPNEPGTFLRNVTVGFFGGIVPLAIQALVPPMIPPPFREAPSWKLMLAFIVIAIIFDSRLWKTHKDTREQLSQ